MSQVGKICTGHSTTYLLFAPCAWLPPLSNQIVFFATTNSTAKKAPEISNHTRKIAIIVFRIDPSPVYLPARFDRRVVVVVRLPSTRGQGTRLKYCHNPFVVA
ncbi:unnamed protein product [Ectocarpus sp. 13 AM-2016]